MSDQEVHTSIAQRVIIKFLVKEGTKPSEILRRLDAQFGEATLSKTQVYEWHKKFLAGREAVENEPHQRRPRTSITAENIQAVRNLIEEDDRIKISEISSNVGISFGSVQAIINDELKYQKLSATWVPRIPQEKNTKSAVCPVVTIREKSIPNKRAKPVGTITSVAAAKIKDKKSPHKVTMKGKSNNPKPVSKAKPTPVKKAKRSAETVVAKTITNKKIHPLK